MELKTKLYLIDEEGEKFMGIGVLWLLQGVKKHGSLRKAAAAMDISYSKAFGMVKRLEETLGKEVLVRQKGGQAREGAYLTTFAESFVILYDEFQQKAKAAVTEPYEDFCKKLAGIMEE